MNSRWISKFLVSIIVLHHSAAQSSYNPSILQDTRNEPKVDGTFGFLYRTEDGIAHAAKGNADGVISGRFSYTDPTGLKVNYNYNAGSSFTPGYSYESAPTAPPARYEAARAPPPARYEPPYGRYEQPSRDAYARQRRPQYQQQEYGPRAQYGPEPRYEGRRTRPAHARRNEVYGDY